MIEIEDIVLVLLLVLALLKLLWERRRRPKPIKVGRFFRVLLGDELCENESFNMLDKIGWEEEVFSILHNATFKDRVFSRIGKAIGEKKAKFRILISPGVDEGVKKLIKCGVRKNNIRVFNPGNLRLLLLKDYSLIIYDDPDRPRKYSGIRVENTALARILRKWVQNEYTKANPYHVEK